MPPGRPPKRSGDGISSSLDSSSGVTKAKLPRLEKSTEDFSSVVKSKLSSYSRTGQACDRCKVRKIRCDALANGCTNCTQQSLECYVTDRVTGRTERRGYLQQLEREKTSLLGHIRDLEKLLEDKGVHVRTWQSTTSAYTPESPYDLKSDQSSKNFWPQSNSLWDKDLKNDGLSLTSMTGGARPIDSHLGIAQDYTPLNSIDGTRLSILGTTVDITSFDAPDVDGPPAGASLASPVYNKSAQSFFNSVSKAHPPIEIPLPPRDEAFNYSEWFFVIIGVFIPVLHKPTYIELLSRVYDDPDFKPTKAELTIVHMVFAMMYYQFGCRDGGDSDKKARFNDISNRHYHWCVNKLWDLMADNTLASVQALILMAIHCRGFPKPGPAFVMCSLAWNRAIEFKLHRQYLNRNEPTTLENEMRKRAFWSIFSVMVLLCGRLGRPMPIRSEDIDVDYPIAIPDECLTEQGVTNPGRIGECSWMAGLAGFKLVPLFLETWNNVYPAQQDPIRYVEAVRRIEQSFQAYQRDIEDVLAETRKSGNVVQATYLESAGYELLMCLRHPSRCATSDPAFLAANYAVCEDMARKLLRSASDLAKIKSLDTTWYQIAVYVTAMFMLLACRWNKRAETTAADLTDLKEYVGMGMAVVGEILNYVGASDAPIIEQITTVIDRTVASIEQEMRTSQRGRPSTKPHLPSSRGAKHHDDYGSQTRRSRGRAARSTSRTPGPSSLSAADQMPIPRMSGIPSTSFYGSPLTQLNTDYSQMGYPELGNPATTTSAGGASYTPMSEDSAHHQYLYATSAGASSAAAQMVHSTPGSSPQSATTQHNPMVAAAYGSQATGPGPSAHGHPHAHAHSHPHSHAPTHQHPHHQHAHQHPQQQHMAGSNAGAHWMPVPSAAAAAAAGSTWSQWTHAVVDPSTQDRYSASTLMNPLGGGSTQRGDHGDAGAGAGTGGTLAGVQQAGGHTAAAQWPMVVYHQSHVSGG